MSSPTTLAELFGSLGLTLTVRAAGEEEDGAWACTLTNRAGATYEIESVTFYDVDDESGEEWVVEPTPSRVLSVLVGGDADEEEDEDLAADAEETEREARAFLGDAAYELLVRIDAAEQED